MLRACVIALIGTALAACAVQAPFAERDAQSTEFEITAEAADGATVFGTASFDGLPDTAPLIVLFHQGGSNARAEYQPLVPWLNANGFRTIGWDLRVGGDIYGLSNRTADARLPVKPASYCEGFPDMQAALETALTYAPTGQVIAWGSSYSGALVFHLAAEEADKLSHVISASPANGSPMADCLPQARLDELRTPAFVLSPTVEMNNEEDFQEKARFEQAGVNVLIVEDGIHGSSMLVDARTEADMSNARDAVIAWLTQDPS